MVAKKTKSEKAKTRAAQNERYRARKAALGLRQVAFWLPAELVEAVEGKERVGLVVAAEGVEVSPGVFELLADGRLRAVTAQVRLPGLSK